MRHHEGFSQDRHSRLRNRVLLAVIMAVLAASETSLASTSTTEESSMAGHSSSSSSREGADDSKNCTNPAIQEFPRDFMSPEERKKGGVVAHLLIALYLVVALGNVCDDYFVPVLEIICDALNLKPDVAGATFMAAGTSSPEFFANVMGTFVTKTDLGIGTIVGSAVFNIFGVIAVCGIFAGRKIYLDWYAISRDCLIYGLTVLCLMVVMMDEKVIWYESLVMVLLYLGYIAIMVLNPKLEKWSHSMHNKLKKRVSPKPTVATIESTPLHGPTTVVQNGNAVPMTPSNGKSFQVPLASTESLGDESDDEGGEVPRRPWKRPEGAGIFGTLWWLLFFPAHLVFFLTIPDVRFGGSWQKLFPLSFFLCMAWIGGISYLLTWMITVVGYTWNIPDSVMGLTFLAIGTSVPEVISSLIVCRQGKGSMAVSNSIGSNTFDILLCLGLPWLIRALISGGVEDEAWQVEVNSEGLAYTVVSLFLSLILLYVTLLIAKFVLSRTLGLVCLVIYAVFLTLSILFELNIFFVVNQPACPTDY